MANFDAQDMGTLYLSICFLSGYVPFLVKTKTLINDRNSVEKGKILKRY